MIARRYQKNHIAFHLFLWVMIALLWLYLRYQDYATLTQAAQVTAVKVIDLVLVIYLTNLVLVPKFLYKKKYLLFGLSFIVLIAFFSWIKMLGVATITSASLQTIDVKAAIYNNFVTQFFLVLASIGMRSAVDYIQLQNRMAAIAKEKAEAELAFLKAQINPHFLFNSINSVYFLIDKKNTAARDALHRFSDMLRYQLYECNDHSIPIEKEIGYLKDYVALQQLRVNDTTSIEFNCDKEVKDFSIEPLLLIPFVENSFKHLSHFSNGHPNQIRINLARQNGSLLFSVYNTTEQKETKEAGGIGLANVQKRLELLYPGKHHLEVKGKEGWYGVELKLSVYQ